MIDRLVTRPRSSPSKTTATASRTAICAARRRPEPDRLAGRGRRTCGNRDDDAVRAFPALALLLELDSRRSITWRSNGWRTSASWLTTERPQPILRRSRARSVGRGAGREPPSGPRLGARRRRVEVTILRTPRPRTSRADSARVSTGSRAPGLWGPVRSQRSGHGTRPNG